ncbi:MAG TPA: ABC transporter permease subunit [Salinisphaeraceae bacterium]|nr:ABC transporter permease subunit [Salinisphaeraceae bacterium]
MSGLLAIARLELQRLFVAPLAWTLLAIMQLLLGLLFAMSVTEIVQNPERINAYSGVSAVVGDGLLRFAAFLLLLIVPLLTMRTFAGERKTGVFILLQTAPTTTRALVLGKFVGLMSFFTLALALVALMPLSLLWAAPLDLGLLGAGLLGLWLLTATFTAAGVCMSTLTREPVLAAVATIGLLLALWLLHAVSYLDWQPLLLGHGVPVAAIARKLALVSHYESLLRGVFASADVAYFLLLTALFLLLAMQRLLLERG